MSVFENTDISYRFAKKELIAEELLERLALF